MYVGSIYLSRGGQTYPISRYIIHGDYDPNDHWRNDICLINVANAIQYNNEVQPVTLPPRDLNIPSGDALTIPGWGVDVSSVFEAQRDRETILLLLIVKSKHNMLSARSAISNFSSEA